jgi:UDPglucose--hexose-1-phosphate uridylyltransferase
MQGILWGRELPELRKDPITGRWVIISTDRARRPVTFLRESVQIKGNGVCPFCPGNEGKTPSEIFTYGRNGGGRDTPGWSLRVIPNKFPALGIEGGLDREGDGLFDRMNGVGAHEVVVETPDHQLTLANMSVKSVEEVFWACRERIIDLKNDRRFRYILLFKNHGEPAGSTIEHGHTQLIALPIVPRRVREEVDAAKHYYDEKERCIFCDIIRQEIESETRVILADEHFVAIAPYAPRFPFESWILPRRHSSAFENMPASQYADLAKLLRDFLQRLDAALLCPSYNFVVHTSPIGEETNDHYHWHIEVMPKLTKVAGFEWGTGFYINPTPPEESARFLREATTK